MTDSPVNLNRLSPSPETSRGSSRRLRLIIMIVVAAVLGLGLGTWWLAEQALGAAPMHLTPKQAQSLAQVNEGAGAELVLQGQSAQDRNAMIPVSGGRLEQVAAFSALGAGNSSYQTALKCMTQAIYYEAANEPVLGKRAVAQVVLNRMRHPAYPSSVCGVVYDGANKAVCQFSFTCDGSLLRAPMARQWQESVKVAAAALNGSVEPSVGTATHYHADYVLPRWAYRLGKIEQIGRHIFYRFKGDWGNSRAFTHAWSGREVIPLLDMARLRNALNAQTDPVSELADNFVPGLTVSEHVTDRHAAADVGGRIDTTKEWRLAIPDPTEASSTYRDMLDRQGETVSKSGTLVAEATPPRKVTP